MALFFECVLQCAQKVLDAADIVRDGDLTTIDLGSRPPRYYNPRQSWPETGSRMKLTHTSTVLVFMVGLLFMLAAEMISAQDKQTSLGDARAAVEANMSTAAGKAYDEQFGAEFGQKHLGPLKQCKQSSGGDLTSFWMLFKLDKDGSVREMLLYPETKLGSCARASLAKDRFGTLPPPIRLLGECVPEAEVSKSLAAHLSP